MAFITLEPGTGNHLPLVAFILYSNSACARLGCSHQPKLCTWPLQDR